jgi:predicted nucleic acid-binding protein
MKLALDTNAYRAHIESNPVLLVQAQNAQELGLPVVVIGELRFGFLNGTRLKQNEDLLARFLGEPRVRILHLTMETTWQFGEVATLLRRKGAALSQNDIWIAALCKQYGYALATRDRDLRHVLGLQIVDF